MSVVVLIVLVVLGLSLAVLLHAVRVAPDGEETEAGYQTEITAASPGILKKSRLLDPATARGRSHSIHAA